MGMSRFLLLAFALVTLTNCGIKRPLIAPKDIPAYEERQRRRMEKINDETTTATPPVAAPAAPAPQGQ